PAGGLLSTDRGRPAETLLRGRRDVVLGPGPRADARRTPRPGPGRPAGAGPPDRRGDPRRPARGAARALAHPVCRRHRAADRGDQGVPRSPAPAWSEATDPDRS